MFCVEVSWKTERPLKYETMRPVSAAISVTKRPPTVRRNVRSATVRRPRPSTDSLTNDQPDVSGDYVTAHQLTTTPENSDVEDARKNAWRDDVGKPRRDDAGKPRRDDAGKPRRDDAWKPRREDAWKPKGVEGAAGKYQDKRKNARAVEEKIGQRVENCKVKGPKCAGDYEEDMRKTKLLEDKFKQQMLQLQQQLGLSAQGYIIPS